MASTPDFVPDWLQRRRVTHPDVTALSTPDRDVSYAQLYNKATILAGALLQRGVRGYVGLLARDGYTFALSVHALMQAGLVVVPLNWRLTTTELAWQVKDARMEWLLYDAPKSESAAEISQSLPALNTVDMSRLETMDDSGPAVSRQHINFCDVQAVMYTSGTTGHPKGVQITYGNEWWSATGVALQLGVLPDDRWLVPMPLFHMGGLSVLLRSVMFGTTAVIHNGFDADSVNAAIDNGEVTLASLVPTMLQRMLSVRDGRPYPDSLRAILLGGSAASMPLLQAAEALGVQVAQSYGMTETASQVCTLPPRDFQRKLGSSGLPAVMNEVRVVDERAKGAEFDEARHQRAPGQPGEIIVRGPTVTTGYLYNDQATAESIQGGWLWTGDIGYLDEEGYLYVLDRRRDMIVSGGENIYPAEIEAVLEGHDAIHEAAVVGVSDGEWGQVPVAVIVVEQGSSVAKAELESFCRQSLAGYKLPRRFVFVERLPRNASGKLMRRTLQEWLESESSVRQH